MADASSRLRELPPIGALLDDARLAPLLVGRRKLWLTRVIQGVVAEMRQELRTTDGPVRSREDDVYCAAIRRRSPVKMIRAFSAGKHEQLPQAELADFHLIDLGVWIRPIRST